MNESGKETNAAKFTLPAARIWDAIPTDARKTLLATAWCSHCRHEVTINDFSGSIKAGNIVLVGTCTECGGAASRIVEVIRDSAATSNNVGSMTIVGGQPKLTWAQASAEMALLTKETKACAKRQKLLTSKEYDGTITKDEARELRQFSKSMNAVLKKMFAIAVGEKLP